MWPGGTPLGLAVSGGPDSLALLALAREAGLAVRVATADHGLRPAAAEEAAAVAALCAELGVPHRTLRLDLPPGGNVQARARAARYTALGAWARDEGLGAIVTAHHRDDQAETLVMRLNRGSGVAGLAGMRPRGPVPGAPDIALLRPLLDFARAELAAVVAERGWVAADDPSNRDARFDRVRVRTGLAAADWLDPARIAASAAHLADADEALEWAATREWDERVVQAGTQWRYAPLAPRAVRLRVLARIVGALANEGTPRGGELAALLNRLEAGGTATLAGVRGDGGTMPWRFAPAPSRMTKSRDR